MGEATIDFHKAVILLDPKIVSGPIRFITPGVALVDGAFKYRSDKGQNETRPLLFVMKKEGTWKIASIRRLALEWTGWSFVVQAACVDA